MTLVAHAYLLGDRVYIHDGPPRFYGKIVATFEEDGYPMYVVRVSIEPEHVDDATYKYFIRSQAVVWRYA